MIFKHSSHIQQFQDYLNSQHVNIKFTSDVEIDKRLSFLDVEVVNLRTHFQTSVYRKPTFTGLGLNFLSFVPELFKNNAVKTLISRCFFLSSNWFNFDLEIKKLLTFFQNNGFPSDLVLKTIKACLQKQLAPPPKYSTVSKDVRYISLPFYGHISFTIRKELNKLLQDYYPQIDFRFIFTNAHTLGSYFKVKDSLPSPLCSNIIYQFSCSGCTARYIGSSIRNLRIRILEHKGLSFRTLRPLSKAPHSEIHDHSLSTDHAIKESDFKILDRCNNTLDLRLLESLHIQNLSPELNSKEIAMSLFTV